MLVKFQSRTWPKINFEHQTSLTNLVANTAKSRIDYKFCVPEKLLEPFLNVLKSEGFSILVFDSLKNSCCYQTKYFDTPEFKNFHEHRCGKLSRKKFRWRNYHETSDSFLEKKEKIKGLRTTKERFKPTEKDCFANQLQKKFNTSPLIESIDMGYERMTLVSHNFQTKITIDRFLTVNNLAKDKIRKEEIMPDFFILEVKTDKISEQGFSVLKKFLHSYRIRKISFSKYCIGMCFKYPNLPRNKWKQIFKKYIK